MPGEFEKMLDNILDDSVSSARIAEETAKTMRQFDETLSLLLDSDALIEIAAEEMIESPCASDEEIQEQITKNGLLITFGGVRRARETVVRQHSCECAFCHASEWLHMMGDAEACAKFCKEGEFEEWKNEIKRFHHEQENRDK